MVFELFAVNRCAALIAFPPQAFGHIALFLS
jgi:hypothetical protein